MRPLKIRFLREENMRTARFLMVALVALGLTAPLSAADSKPNPGWEKLKSLAGEWEGTEGGKPFQASYKLVSSGTAVMETLDGPDAMQMITIYTKDGGSLLMTHYCSMGNQPRMRSKGLENDKLTFAYVDAANLKSKDEMHMTGLVLTFKDADHLGADWTHSLGVKKDVGRFEFARKK
jgi:hypothetical protein